MIRSLANKVSGTVTPWIRFMSVDSRRWLIGAGLAGVITLAVVGGPAPEKGATDTTPVAAAAQERSEDGKTASRSVRPTPGPTAKKAEPKKTIPAKPKPAVVKPVAGLDQKQMNNAAKIVKVGKDMKLSKRAQIIAIATAMQESQLYNLASDVIPESTRYPHEGTGADHDSVGLFQQRSSTGWGPIRDLMKPEFAARQFYSALVDVDGWQNMPITVAAQTVQVSAFPDHYAKHEWAATQVVNALNK